MGISEAQTVTRVLATHPRTVKPHNRMACQLGRERLSGRPRPRLGWPSEAFNLKRAVEAANTNSVRIAVRVAVTLVVLASWPSALAQTSQSRRASTAPASSYGERSALFAKWAKIREPLAGPAAAVGFYAAGCLQGAEALPLDDDGYSVMRPSRHRFYGHPSLVSYITNLASTARAKFGTRLLIGDMAPPRGGPMLTGHASHQNGLDVDVWFTRTR